MSAVEASLKRLKTDWLDLYQLHHHDPKTPLEETMRALDDLVKQGKVRYLGFSTLVGWPFVDMQWTARHFGADAADLLQNPNTASSCARPSAT